jgi:pimeloyl-ACP methyl ester carboxylesterase
VPKSSRSRLRRLGQIVSRALLVLALLLTLVANGCTGWLARAIVWGPNTDKMIDPAQDADERTLHNLGVARALRVDVGPPPASLSAWVVDPSDRASLRATVLVLHGITDHKETMLGVAKDLAAAGYRAVLVDLRGHGRSSGQWLTFGVVESQDLKQLVDDLDVQRLLAGPVGVFGPSYGGGVAIQYAAADPRVRAVVAVCPFSSLRSVTPSVVRMYAPWPANWLLLDSTINRAVTRSGELASFDPNRADAVRAIAETDAQVLLIHGKGDRKIPPAHSERLHAAAPGHSKLILLDGHAHDSILAGDAGGVVMRESLAWFRTWLASPQSATAPSSRPASAAP